MSQPTHAVCTRCHQHKPLTQLNGYNPITGDTNRVYCIRLTECRSNASQQLLSAITVGCVPRTNPIVQSKQEA